MGTTLISDEIYDVISHPQCEGGVFSMGLTYFGHPLACRAALTNIKIIEAEGLLKHARDMGSTFQQTAKSLSDLEHVGDVRGHGLMLAVDLMADLATKTPFPVNAQAGAKVFRACSELGLIVHPVGDRIVLSSPLVIEIDDINQIFLILRQAIGGLSAR